MFMFLPLSKSMTIPSALHTHNVTYLKDESCIRLIGVNLTAYLPTIRFYFVGKQKLIASPFEHWFNIKYKN